MQVIKSVVAMQRLAGRWRREGARIGFVPTMGCLHAGHLSLVRRARREAGSRGKVVLSIYVNPAQFAPNEDFFRYPRDVKRDLSLCRAEGVDVAFVPGDKEMYSGCGRSLLISGIRRIRSAGSAESRPTGMGFSTYVVEEELSQRMEGASRPGHFRGVTTVVAKLFHIVQPHVAVFGAKDYQQAAIIRRMVRDLNFPVKVVVGPTVREPDGLAMSSRNRNLKGNLRSQAVVVPRSMLKARNMVRKSNVIPAARLKARIRQWVQKEPAARLDYVEFFDPETLVPVSGVKRGTHMALAAFVGQTRLIDNTPL
jgi:pantoate--beta-alanine ligase